CLEFEDQWPREKPGLRERLDRALEKQPRCSGWLIYTDNPYPGGGAGPADQLPCGIILVTPEVEEQAAEVEVLEFFVWLRGAYRNSGLGRFAVRRVLEQLRPAAGQKDVRLRVRLPVGELTGPGGKLQKS